MIQRLQTVFMVLAIAMLGLFLWLPLLRIEGPNGFYDETQGWNVLHFVGGYFYFINLIFTSVAIWLTFNSIILYKRWWFIKAVMPNANPRNIQVFLCSLAIVFIIAAEAFVYYKYQTRIYSGDVILRKWNLFSLAAIGFEALAIFYIRKDEALVKSMDRLR